MEEKRKKDEFMSNFDKLCKSYKLIGDVFSHDVENGRNRQYLFKKDAKFTDNKFVSDPYVGAHYSLCRTNIRKIELQYPSAELIKCTINIGKSRDNDVVMTLYGDGTVEVSERIEDRQLIKNIVDLLKKLCPNIKISKNDLIA